MHAVLSPSNGVLLDPAALLAHCHSRIAGYKCPRSFDIWQTSLPLSGANKLHKPALRAPYWEGRASRLIWGADGATTAFKQEQRWHSKPPRNTSKAFATDA